MSQAADLLSQAQAFHAEQFPATITIGIQSYAAAKSGLRRGFRNVEGGTVSVKTISFWVIASAFASAGQPEPDPAQAVTVTESGVDYILEATRVAGPTMILECVAPE